MDRNLLNYIVSGLLLIVFILSGATGVFKFLTVYGLVGGVKFLPFFLINKVHDWSGVIMSVLVIAHVVLNWNFLVGMTKKIFGRGKK